MGPGAWPEIPIPIPQGPPTPSPGPAPAQGPSAQQGASPPRLCDTSPSPSPCPGAPGCVHKYPTSQGPSSTRLWACPRPPHPYPPRSQLRHVREPASAQPGTPRQTPARDSHGLSSCGPRVSPSKSRLTASRTTTLLGGASPSAGGMGPAPRGCFPGPTSLREAVWG